MNSRGAVVFSIVFLFQIAVLYATRTAMVEQYGYVLYFGSVAVLCAGLLITLPDDDND